MTTEWFVIGWVPLVPICSKRISYNRTSPYAIFDQSGYYVQETTAVHRKQALWIYGWFTSLIAPIIIWANFQDELTKVFGDEDRAAGLCLLISAIVLVLPYFLRLWTKRQNAEKWKRASLGFGPIE
ncbi:MAG: hypothetical protein ABJF23_01900 [Bryobacteraceae bacterium]